MTCECGKLRRSMAIEASCDQELCNVTLGRGPSRTETGTVFVPKNCNLGEYHVLEFTICLNCGHVDGEWPITHDIKLTNSVKEYKQDYDDSF